MPPMWSWGSGLILRAGIMSINVPWPASTSTRRAKLLTPTASTYLVGAQNLDAVIVKLQKGNVSTFFPLRTDEEEPVDGVVDLVPTVGANWLQLFNPSSGLSIPQFTYRLQGCDILEESCVAVACEPNDYLLASPYGDWVIKATGTSLAGNAVSPSAFSTVESIRVIFTVRRNRCSSGFVRIFIHSHPQGLFRLKQGTSCREV